MAKIKVKNDSEALLQLVVNALQEKKANDVVSLDLRNIKDTVSNFFVVTHGDSSTHVNALHQTVVEFSRKAGQPPYRVEGTENSEWIIVDFIDVVVHIFLRDKRSFYQLEELWHDAPATNHDTEKPEKKRTSKTSATKVRPEIDGKEYKDKVTIAKLKQKSLKDTEKTAKKSASKTPAKKTAGKPTAKKAPKNTTTKKVK